MTARAKRYSRVAAVRDEASVVLDALLMSRKDLDEEFGKERRAELLALALVGYRLFYPRGPLQGGLLWSKGKDTSGAKCHRLFCRFCGQHIADVHLGKWTRLNQDERYSTTGRHILICALQFLAGIRPIASPGTTLHEHDGPLFNDARVIVGSGPLFGRAR